MQASSVAAALRQTVTTLTSGPASEVLGEGNGSYAPDRVIVLDIPFSAARAGRKGRFASADAGSRSLRLSLRQDSVGTGSCESMRRPAVQGPRRSKPGIGWPAAEGDAVPWEPGGPVQGDLVRNNGSATGVLRPCCCRRTRRDPKRRSGASLESMLLPWCWMIGFRHSPLSSRAACAPGR